MVENGQGVVESLDAVDPIDMAALEDVPEQFDPLSVRNVSEALGVEASKVRVWEVPPGAYMGIHGHETQEEVYHVLSGRFAVDLGPPGETERVELEPGAFFAASPETARGYRNVGTEPGRMLVVAAPNVDEDGIPEDELGA